MADEVLGLGTHFEGASLGEVLTLRDLEGPNEEAEDIKVSSNIDAVADAGVNFSHRFRPGMTDPGEIKLTAVYTANGYNAARDGRRVQQVFTITAEDGSTLVTTDESYIKSVSPSYPWEGEAVFDIVVKVSGDSEFSPA